MSRRMSWVLLVALLFSLAGRAAADVAVVPSGIWPKSWPKELEPLRAQARTIDGPLAGFYSYEIPFKKQDEFEAAWPHLLKVHRPDYPITIVRSPMKRTGAAEGPDIVAGVVVNSWPTRIDGKAQDGANAKATSVIVLVVDGDVVDLKRIRLPLGVRIRDERKKDKK